MIVIRATNKTKKWLLFFYYRINKLYRCKKITTLSAFTSILLLIYNSNSYFSLELNMVSEKKWHKKTASFGDGFKVLGKEIIFSFLLHLFLLWQLLEQLSLQHVKSSLDKLQCCLGALI